MIDDGELMPSLAVYYHVHVLCGDILMKANYCLRYIQVHLFVTSVQLIK